MAKWFRDFPITLRNGTDRIRLSSESGSQTTRTKPGVTVGTVIRTGGNKGSLRKTSESDGGGVGSLLSGRNRKNSAIELGRNGTTGSVKDGRVWDSLIPGKSRKNKTEAAPEEQRSPKSSILANSYTSRLIKVDKLEKNPNYSNGTGGSGVTEIEKTKAANRTETVSNATRIAVVICL